MSLKESQRDFIQYLYSPKPAEDQQLRAREMFLSEDKPDPGNGLKIYRKNLLFGMLLALEDTYSFTRALLGANNFNFLCREYIYSHPSTDSDLTVYGGELGDFLSGRAEIKTWPFLADVARLEWARDRAFYAPKEDAVAAPLFAGLASLRLLSSVALISSNYQLDEAWSAFQKGGLQHLSNPAFPLGEEHLVVAACAGTPHQIKVAGEVAAMVGAILEGQSMERIRSEMTASALDSALAFIFQKGWVKSFLIL